MSAASIKGGLVSAAATSVLSGKGRSEYVFNNVGTPLSYTSDKVQDQGNHIIHENQNPLDSLTRSRGRKIDEEMNNGDNIVPISTKIQNNTGLLYV